MNEAGSLARALDNDDKPVDRRPAVREPQPDPRTSTRDGSTDEVITDLSAIHTCE